MSLKKAITAGVRTELPLPSKGRPGWLALAALAALTAQGAPRSELRFDPRIYGDRPSVAELTELGRKLFFDPGLSASGKQACASCHSPQHAYGPPNELAVQLGGADLKQPGTRAVPTLRYLQTTIPFTEHYIDDDDGHGEDGGPTGGLTWDGRVNTAQEQAALPLLAQHEMANRDATDLAARVAKAAYADEFRRVVSAPGQDVLREPAQVLGWVKAALGVFQQSPADFYPFTSKYDAFLRHQVQLSPAEARGLGVFNDPTRGNCASCHPSGKRASGAFPLFTDAAYSALGVPRNPDIPANRDPAYFDLGLCGPLRTDLRAAAQAQPDLCGRFKTPTLRNVALRKSYFHNGIFHSLRQVLEFYAQRDTAPQRWYPRDAQGQVNKFDDLPPPLRSSVHQDAPFGGQSGGKPALSDADIDDLLAFLGALTDGYQPAALAEDRRAAATSSRPAISNASVSGSGTGAVTKLNR